MCGRSDKCEEGNAGGGDGALDQGRRLMENGAGSGRGRPSPILALQLGSDSGSQAMEATGSEGTHARLVRGSAVR